MSATLLAMEKEVLEEGREWTRARLQERLQHAADAIPPMCARSGSCSSASKRRASR